MNEADRTQSSLPIKLITFDLGHTLIGCDYNALSRFMSRYFGPITPAQVLKAEQRFRAKKPIFETEHHHSLSIPKNSYLYYEALAMGCTGQSPEQHGEVFEEFAVRANQYHDEKGWFMVLWPESVHVLEMLKPHFKLGIISNANGKLKRDLEILGILSYFSFIMDSGVEGVRKPDQEIFRRALQAGGVAAENTLHIGDHPEADVQGALSMGMNAWHYDAQGIFNERIPGVPYSRNLVDVAEKLIRTVC